MIVLGRPVILGSMKWLPGGWQRADRAQPERGTVPVSVAPEQGTAKYTPADAAAYAAPPPHGHNAAPAGRQGGMLTDAYDVDVSASLFRNFLVGGGTSALATVLIAAVMVNQGPSIIMWLWQLLFGVAFVWFVTAGRGMLASRGFLLDRSGFYARTQGTVVGVPWQEISAVGIGQLPWIQDKRPTHPERRQALEFFPADGAFADRHPQFDRWLVQEPPPMRGLPGVRYRFHLPPFTRIPRTVEQAVRAVEPRKWVGSYQRQSQTPPRS